MDEDFSPNDGSIRTVNGSLSLLSLLQTIDRVRYWAENNNNEAATLEILCTFILITAVENIMCHRRVTRFSNCLLYTVY